MPGVSWRGSRRGPRASPGSPRRPTSSGSTRRCRRGSPSDRRSRRSSTGAVWPQAMSDGIVDIALLDARLEAEGLVTRSLSPATSPASRRWSLDRRARGSVVHPTGRADVRPRRRRQRLARRSRARPTGGLPDRRRGLRWRHRDPRHRPTASAVRHRRSTGARAPPGRAGPPKRLGGRGTHLRPGDLRDVGPSLARGRRGVASPHRSADRPPGEDRRPAGDRPRRDPRAEPRRSPRPPSSSARTRRSSGSNVLMWTAPSS